MSLISEEELPSPSEELKDVPFARISKTIRKSAEEREEMIATYKRQNSNKFQDISPSSASSKDFGNIELNDSSPSTKDKKSEKTLKIGNTGKLNEKYAMMQQKMTHMAQEITYPRSTSSRNSKNLSLDNINTTQRDDEMANPFLINTSNANGRTSGNLMNKWSDLNLDRRNLIENPEKEISSEEIGHTNTLTRPQTPPGNGEHVIKWKNNGLNLKPSESFTSCDTSDINTSSLGFMTPNFRRGKERSSLQTTPIKKTRWTQSEPRLNSSTYNGPFSTPVHSPKPSLMSETVNTIRKHARRIATIWPPPSLEKDDQEDEDEIDTLLASPSPTFNKRLCMSNEDDDDDITNSLDNSRYNQTSPTPSDTNIYTRQLSQQNLSFADAARNPIFTETVLESIDEFFLSADKIMDPLDL